MLLVRNAIVNPSTVAAGVLILNIVLCEFLHLRVNGYKLLIGQPQHYSEGVVLCKNITDQFLFVSMGNAPAILLAIRKDDLGDSAPVFC